MLRIYRAMFGKYYLDTTSFFEDRIRYAKQWAEILKRSLKEFK